MIFLGEKSHEMIFETWNNQSESLNVPIKGLYHVVY